MKLRLKLLLILASLWALVFVSIYFYSHHTLTKDYIRLEQHELVDSIQQTNKTLMNILSSVKLISADWAQWDDAYKFMQDKNLNFIKSNMEFTSFENSKINLILFYTNEGGFFYGKNYDLTSKKFIPIPRDFLDLLEKQKNYTLIDDTKGRFGILKTNEGYVVLSAQPILTSKGTGPKAGILIMGYFFTEAQLEKLSEIVNLQVNLYTLPLLTNADPLLKQANKSLLENQPYFLYVTSKSKIDGFTFIRDIEKKPIGILKVTQERSLYNQGLETIQRYLTIIVVIGLLFIAATWVLVKKFILDRIINISDEIITINQKSDFSHRIDMKGSDELTNMVIAFNALMEIIELTQEQLKYRIFLRTEELQRLSLLNKNLYSEVTEQRENENKFRSEEKTLRQMAYYDSLTGLPNRLYFHEIMQKILTKSTHDGSNFALLFIDVDHFKNINDSYGHDIGDKYLAHLGNQLRQSIKYSDIAARIGGDEFLVCLNNVRGKELISHITEKILKNISTPLSIDNLVLSPSISIGISCYPQDGLTLEDLEKHADLAMYYAKKKSGNAFCHYSEMHQDSLVT